MKRRLKIIFHFYTLGIQFQRTLRHIMLCVLSLASIASGAQTAVNPDNQVELDNIKDAELKALLFKADSFFFVDRRKVGEYGAQALQLASKLGDHNAEIIAMNMVGEGARNLGDFPKSLEMQFKALELSRSRGNLIREAYSLTLIGFTRSELEEYRTALRFYFEAKSLYDKIQPPLLSFPVFNLSNIGEAYGELGKYDSALMFLTQALRSEVTGNRHILTTRRLAHLQNKMGNHREAIQLYHHALLEAARFNDNIHYIKVRNSLAAVYLAIGNSDSSFYYARQAFEHASRLDQRVDILEASRLLGTLLKKKAMPDSVIYYQDVALKMQDTIYGPARVRELSLVALREQQRQQDITKEQDEYKARARLLLMLVSLLAVSVIAFTLYRKSRQKQKANVLLQEKNIAIEESLSALKKTQAQLIQSEKMASLGELTAGIAHEIQNPLNFVNNFSEVNAELIEELKEEANKGNLSEVKTIANEIKENEGKIVHHGKRADAIVKGMLQHSRASSGTKEPTDINALCDEYLRLSYHGLRAKDKTFNAKFETDFDSTLEKINVIPQDIGRVILNLINNAFYAVAEKQKQNLNGFEPTVSVSTKVLNARPEDPVGRARGKVEIKVADNGNGIPDHIKQKIFQPFFTTKPTGQGTGLGLSLSYDIVKAHGGTLEVNSPPAGRAGKEGVGSEFIVQLPT